MRHPEHMTTRGSIPTNHRRCPSNVPRWVTLLVVIMLLIGSAVAAYATGSDIAKDFPVVNHVDGKEFAVASAVDSAGNTIVAGYQTVPLSSYYDFYTVKFKADGSGVLWQVPFGSGTLNEQISAMVIDSAGDIIVTGTVLNASDRDIVTIKYKGSDGSILWKGVYQGTGDGSGHDYSTSVVVDGSNNVYVAGYSLVSRKFDYLVLKYAKDNSSTVNATPVVTHYNNATVRQDHKANSIAVGTDGFVVTGESSNGTNLDCLTVKFDLAGNFLWEQRISSAYNKSDSGKFVKIDSLNNVIVAGYVYNVTDTDMFTIKYNASGVKVWDAIYDSGYRDEPSALAVDPDNDVYVAGFTHGHRYTVKYSGIVKAPTQVIWSHTMESGGDTSDVPTGIVVDKPTDAVFVTGYSQTDGGTLADYDVLTTKYNKTTGHLLWQKSSWGAFNTDLPPVPVVLDGQPVGVGISSTYVSVSGWTIRPLETGSAVSTSLLRTTTINDPTKNWTASLAGKYVKVTSGSNAGQKRAVSANSETVLTVDPAFSNPVSTGDTFFLFDPSDYDFFVMNYDKGDLDPPTNLQAKTMPVLDGTIVIGVKLQLTWEDNSPNATGFKIERCKGKSCIDFAPLVTVNRPYTYSPGGLVLYDDLSTMDPETYYSYRVKAYLGAGDSYPSNSSHALTHYVAYLPPAYTVLYNNTVTNKTDQATAIAVGPDNNPIVTGSTFSLDGGSDYLTMKRSKVDLAPIWTQRYTSSYIQGDFPTCIAVDNNGQALVSGYSYQPGGINGSDSYALFTIKYLFSPDPPPEEDVARIWQWSKPYHGLAGVDDRATAVAASTDNQNNVVVVGHGLSATFAQNGHENIYVLKYLANGTLDWSATYAQAGDDAPTAATFDPDGNIIVVGYSEKGYLNYYYNLFVAKYCGSGTGSGINCKGKSKGQIIWSDLYDGPAVGPPNKDAKAYGVAVDKAGDVYVTGYVENVSGNKDMITIKYQGTPPATSPVKLWNDFKSFDGLAHGDDQGVAVKIDPIDGNIVVAGTTLTDIYDNDFHIIRYGSATGNVIWEKTLQREQTSDTLTSMAMDYSGNVYLAGTSTNGETSDILSVVYDYLGKIVGATLYDSPEKMNDGANAVAVNSVGDSFIAGYAANKGIPASGIDPNLDYLVIKQEIDLSKTIMAPGPFTAEPQSDYTKIRLTWRANTPNTSFRITRVNDGVTWVVGPGILEYIDTVSGINTRYDYTIEAFIGPVNSRQLSTFAITTLDKPVFNAINLSGGVTKNSINLTWTAKPASTGYKLERSTDNSTWVQVPATGDLAGGSLASYLDNTGLIEGQRYYYRLSAKTLSGYSLPSVQVNAATIPAVPALRLVSPAYYSSNEIHLVWDPSVLGATGFTLEYRIALSDTTWTAWTAVGADIAYNVLSYSHTGLLSGTKYGYQIKSKNDSGQSAYSTVDVSTTTVLTLPQIGDPAYVSKTNNISLTWNDPNSPNAYSPNGNEDKFKIYYQQCAQSYPNICDAAYDNYPANSTNANWSTPPVSIDIPANSTSIVVSDTVPPPNVTNRLQRGRTYRFWIVASRNGVENNTVTVSNKRRGTVSLLDLTKLRVSSFNDTYINFAWDDIVGNYIFRVYCKAGAGAYQEVSTGLGPDSTSFSWLSATPSTTYTCYHTANNDYETVSSFLDPVTINTLGGRPSMVSVAGVGQDTPNTFTGIYIKWNTIAGTNGWKVYRDTWNSPSTTPPATGDSGWANSWTDLMGGTNFLSAATTEFTDTTAVRGNFYRYKVAYKLSPLPPATDNNYSAYSDPPLWAASWPVAPVSLSVTGSDSLTTAVSWGNVNAETGFVADQKLRTLQACPAGTDCCAAETDWNTNTVHKNTTTDVLSTSYTTTTTPTNREIYCYHVKAVNGVGNSGSSPWSSVVTRLRPPKTFTLSNIASTITLNWSNDSDTVDRTGYKLEYTIGGSTTWNQLSTYQGVSATSFTHTGLAADQRYDYRIRTVHGNGISEPTPVLFAHTTPKVPTTLAAPIASPTSITLTWNMDENVIESGYTLQYRKKSGATCLNTDAYWDGSDPLFPVVTKDLQLPTIGQLEVKTTEISAATVYCFRLNAYADNINLSPIPPRIHSLYGAAIESATLLPAPSNFRVAVNETDITATSIMLTWDRVDNNYGYKLQRSTSSDFSANLVAVYDSSTASDATLTYNDGPTPNALSPATTYYYRIYTKNLRGALSQPPSGTSVLTLTSAPPKFTATAVSPYQINLSWESVAGQNTNVLYRTVGPLFVKTIANPVPLNNYCGFDYPTVGCPSPVPATITYPNTGLQPNTRYCYYVIALNANTLESAKSPPQPPYPDPITDLCVTTPRVGPIVTAEDVNGMNIKLSWTYPGPNEGFEVDAQLVNGNWLTLGTVQTTNTCASDPSKCTYEDKNGVIDAPFKDKNGIVNDRIYQYRVRAYQGTVKSDYGYASTKVIPFIKPVCP